MDGATPSLSYERPVYTQRLFRTRLRERSFLIFLPSITLTVLLVVLSMIVNLPFILHPGIVVDLPVAAFTGGAPMGSLVVTLSQEGLIFFDDERMSMNELAAALRERLAQDPESALVIEADRNVPQARLVAIYNIGAAAGIRKVVIATGLSSSNSQ